MGSQPAAKKTPMWLDVDTGHDDAFAILLAAHHPNIELLGISTTYGNAPLSKTTYNTRAILKAINREDIPVYTGAHKPFCRSTWHAPEIHGESGLDGTTVLPTPSVDAAGDGPGVAVEAMAKAIRATEKGTAWLVPTGALTNTALLFSMYPDLAEHLAGVSIMGGAVAGGFTGVSMGRVDGEEGGFERVGNFTPWAEFNIYIDPESAKAVFSNRALAAKTTLVPLDLTHQFLANESVRDGLRYGFDQPARKEKAVSTVRQLFLEILQFFTDKYAAVFKLTSGPPVHDVLAVAAAVMPEAFDDRGGERFVVDVVTEGKHGPGVRMEVGSQCGRTVVSKTEEEKGGVRIPRALEEGRVWRVLGECLARAEA